MEGVLSWEGEIGNARVRQLFNLQPVQASRLLADWGVPSWLIDQAEGDATPQWSPQSEQMERLTLALGLDQGQRL